MWSYPPSTGGDDMGKAMLCTVSYLYICIKMSNFWNHRICAGIKGVVVLCRLFKTLLLCTILYWFSCQNIQFLELPRLCGDKGSGVARVFKTFLQSTIWFLSLFIQFKSNILKPFKLNTLGLEDIWLQSMTTSSNTRGDFSLFPHLTEHSAAKHS